MITNIDQMKDEELLWVCRFDSLRSYVRATDPNPARAVTKAFVQHEEAGQ